MLVLSSVFHIFLHHCWDTIVEAAIFFVPHRTVVPYKCRCSSFVPSRKKDSTRSPWRQTPQSVVPYKGRFPRLVHTQTYWKFLPRFCPRSCTGCDVSAVMSHETPWYFDHQCESTNLFSTCCLTVVCCLVCKDWSFGLLLLLLSRIRTTRADLISMLLYRWKGR